MENLKYNKCKYHAYMIGDPIFTLKRIFEKM